MESVKHDLIHSTYKKGRLIVLGFILLSVLFMSVGYASNYQSILSSKGIIGIGTGNKNLEIISIEMVDYDNINSHSEKYEISSDSTDKEKILVANIDLDFYRTMGSDDSFIEYKITIKNNSLESRTFSDYSSNYSFNGDSATYTYKLSGASKGTTIIDPGESVTFTLTLYLSDTTRSTHYYLTDNFKFNFGEVDLNSFRLSPSLVTKNVSFNDLNSIIPVSFKVINKSNDNATYEVYSGNDNFTFVSSDGSKLNSFNIDAGTSQDITAYLMVSDEHFFDNTSYVVDVKIKTTSPSILIYDVGDIDVTIPQSKTFTLLSGKTINKASSIDFLNTSNTAGIYKTLENEEPIYFYRGNVNNNYVSFAGYTWRIIKIDKYGVRVILNTSSGSSKWANSTTVTNSGETGLTEAKEVLDYDNSLVKTSLDSWFSSNLSSYKINGVIKTSNFCVDNSTVILSGSNNTSVYYFGSYKRIGSDTTNYTPLFNCESQYNREYDIGLISADEVAFAGGVFNTDTSNYYMYWNTGSWWTISPSYYDSGTNLKTVNVFEVTANGNLTDWPDSDLVAGTRYIRPVITLNTERLSGGAGTSSNPYTFS